MAEVRDAGASIEREGNTSVKEARVNRDLTLFVGEGQVQAAVAELARQIDASLGGSPDLVLVGVLRGAVYFLTDLSRALRTPHRIDFVEYESYRGTSKGEGRLVKDCSGSIEDADVVIVDEVYDTGETLQRLRETMTARRPHSLAACVLFVKGAPPAAARPEFSGIAAGNTFLVGYGMDLEQRLRHLPWVGTVGDR
jgi:hypoxanthine phosphoribosyltransferase